MSQLLASFCADDYAGFGNSLLARGGHGSKRAHMKHCLRLLRNVVCTQDETVLNDLTEQGILNQLVSECIMSTYVLMRQNFFVVRFNTLCDKHQCRHMVYGITDAYIAAKIHPRIQSVS